MPEHDPDLLERLENCRQNPFEGTVYRVVWPDRSPTEGSSVARARWNSPDNTFEVLNKSLTSEGAAAEFEAFWSLFEQRPDRPALSWTLTARLRRVVSLDSRQLEELGIRRADYARRDYTRTQEISSALSYLGCHGLIVPSARYDCRNLVVYVRNLDSDCSVDETSSSAFNWSGPTI
ncbi:MAG: RES domain-containing protein [Gammaproteobacteria bacterium]|nr:RES domain-containing protein [Gammaproteobacteria bacterium]